MTISAARFLFLSLFVASFMVESATGELNLRQRGAAPTMNHRKLKKTGKSNKTSEPKETKAPKGKGTKAPKAPANGF